MRTDGSEVSCLGLGEAGARRTFVAVLVAACASLALYLWTPQCAVQLTSAEPTRVSEVFPWVKPITRAWLAALHEPNSAQAGHGMAFFFCCTGLFLIYVLLLRLVKGPQPASVHRLLLAGGAAFLLALLFSPVMLSADSYAYAFYGRVLSVYQSDPHSVIPNASAADPFLAAAGRTYGPTAYGPIWTLIAAGVAWFGGTRIGLTVLLFRALAVAAVLSAAWLISSLLRRLSPDRAAQGIVFFLWNPLVVMETGLSGHNDGTVMALALFAMWLHFHERKTAATVALVLSALVKCVVAPLVPLYLLMLVRESPSWGERGRLLLRTSGVALLVVAAAMVSARMKAQPGVADAATSADCYSNNFHELIFKGIRRLLGEDACSVEVPMDFGSWWVESTSTGELHAFPSHEARVLAGIAPHQQLLVIAPPEDGDWLRVYDHVSRKRGYVASAAVKAIPDPEGAADWDPTVDRLQDTPMDWATVIQANMLLRLTIWGLFAAFGLLAAWRTPTFARFLVWAPAVLLASQLLVVTQIWPWYLIWPLALGALRPANLPARLAILLSAGVLTLYVSFNYAEATSWLYPLRSIPAIVLPLFAFALLYRQRLRLPAWGGSPA